MTAALVLLLAVVMFIGQNDKEIADWLARREREFLRSAPKKSGVLADLADKGSCE